MKGLIKGVFLWSPSNVREATRKSVDEIGNTDAVVIVYEVDGEVYWTGAHSAALQACAIPIGGLMGGAWRRRVGDECDVGGLARNRLWSQPQDCGWYRREVHAWLQNYYAGERPIELTTSPRSGGVSLGTEQTTETTETEKTMTKYNSEITKGIEQAVADEVSEALFTVAAEILGDSLSNLSPAGRELAKAGVAIGLATLVQHLPQLPVPRAKVEQGASLQIQTATMRLVQPHIGRLRELAVKMAGTVTSATDEGVDVRE